MLNGTEDCDLPSRICDSLDALRGEFWIKPGDRTTATNALNRRYERVFVPARESEPALQYFVAANVAHASKSDFVVEFRRPLCSLNRRMECLAGGAISRRPVFADAGPLQLEGFERQIELGLAVVGFPNRRGELAFDIDAIAFLDQASRGDVLRKGEHLRKDDTGACRRRLCCRLGSSS